MGSNFLKNLTPTMTDVENYLSAVMHCIVENDYQISKREKNDNFQYNYLLTPKDIKALLLELTASDFKKAVLNNNAKTKEQEEEVLYIFHHWTKIYDEMINLYIKTNLIRSKNGKLYTIFVSVHEVENYTNMYF